MDRGRMGNGHAPAASPQRNRILGLTLAIVVTLIFAFVIVSAFVFHHAEAHHLFSNQ